MPTEYGGRVNIGPLIRAEVARLRAKGCTKSPINIEAAAWRNVMRRGH